MMVPLPPVCCFSRVAASWPGITRKCFGGTASARYPFHIASLCRPLLGPLMHRARRPLAALLLLPLLLPLLLLLLLLSPRTSWRQQQQP